MNRKSIKEEKSRLEIKGRFNWIVVHATCDRSKAEARDINSPLSPSIIGKNC